MVCLSEFWYRPVTTKLVNKVLILAASVACCTVMPNSAIFKNTAAGLILYRHPVRQRDKKGLPSFQCQLMGDQQRYPWSLPGCITLKGSACCCQYKTLYTLAPYLRLFTRNTGRKPATTGCNRNHSQEASAASAENWYRATVCPYRQNLRCIGNIYLPFAIGVQVAIKERTRHCAGAKVGLRRLTVSTISPRCFSRSR